MWKVTTSAPLLSFFSGEKEQMTMDIAAIMDSHYLETHWGGAVVLPDQYFTSVSEAECSWNLHELGHCLARQSVAWT